MYSCGIVVHLYLRAFSILDVRSWQRSYSAELRGTSSERPTLNP